MCTGIVVHINSTYTHTHIMCSTAPVYMCTTCTMYYIHVVPVCHVSCVATVLRLLYDLYHLYMYDVYLYTYIYLYPVVHNMCTTFTPHLSYNRVLLKDCFRNPSQHQTNTNTDPNQERFHHLRILVFLHVS